MGMTAYFKQVSPELLAKFQKKPSLAHNIMQKNDVSFERLLTEEGLFLEKAWHGIHFILTGEINRSASTLSKAIVGSQPLNSTIKDTTEIYLSEIYYLTSHEVKEITEALAEISLQEFTREINVQAMTQAGVYPDAWSAGKSEVASYLLPYYSVLVEFYQKAAHKGNAVLVTIT